MPAIEHLTQFFRGEENVVAAYLYGQPATDRTWPDSDIEVALLLRDSLGAEAATEYLEAWEVTTPWETPPGSSCRLPSTPTSCRSYTKC